MPTTSKPKLYSPRHPERTQLYQTVAEHYAIWLELASAGNFFCSSIAAIGSGLAYKPLLMPSTSADSRVRAQHR